MKLFFTSITFLVVPVKWQTALFSAQHSYLLRCSIPTRTYIASSIVLYSGVDLSLDLKNCRILLHNGSPPSHREQRIKTKNNSAIKADYQLISTVALLIIASASWLLLLHRQQRRPAAAAARRKILLLSLHHHPPWSLTPSRSWTRAAATRVRTRRQSSSGGWTRTAIVAA